MALSMTTVNVTAPFQAARSGRMAARMPRTVVMAHSRQGPSDAGLKAAGALAAVQLTLLPLAGAAVADVMPNTWNTADLQKQVLFGFGEKAKQKVDELKGNVAQAAAQKDDAAERVVPESPGTSQEDNAEKVRREAENGPTTGGDARAPTN